VAVNKLCALFPETSSQGQPRLCLLASAALLCFCISAHQWMQRIGPSGEETVWLTRHLQDSQPEGEEEGLSFLPVLHTSIGIGIGYWYR